MANDEAAKKKAKLAKLLKEFEGDELTDILSEELDSTTRRAIAPKAAAGDPKKVEFQKALVETFTPEDIALLKKWTDESKTGVACRVTSDAPANMDDGLGGKYDRLTVIFQFSSEKIRQKTKNERAAKAE